MRYLNFFKVFESSIDEKHKSDIIENLKDICEGVKEYGLHYHVDYFAHLNGHFSVSISDYHFRVRSGVVGQNNDQSGPKKYNVFNTNKILDIVERLSYYMESEGYEPTFIPNIITDYVSMYSHSIIRDSMSDIKNKDILSIDIQFTKKKLKI